ncbi:MAG: alkaline phosphatase family protein [Geitlerinemataceae cyanobacterium]
MSHPVIAIGLDAADPNLLELWMARGYLPNLSRLKTSGAYARLFNTVPYNGVVTETSSTERLWTMFGTSCFPTKTGYWSPVHYHAEDYSIVHDTENGAYPYREYSPFYALSDRRVAAFDVPVAALHEDITGPQILGWGGHAPHTPSHSEPPELFSDLEKRYGKNPVLHRDYGYWWDEGYKARIKSAMQTSIEQKSAICRELLAQERWDLFLTVFGETHSAGHDFWFASKKDHPLYKHLADPADDPMLTAFKRVDRAVGEIVDSAPDDAHIVVFAPHGMDNNVTDMYSMTFLPELLYRMSFGSCAIGANNAGKPLPEKPNLEPRRKTWTGEIWQQRYDASPIKRALKYVMPSKFDSFLDAGPNPAIDSPHELRERGAALNWMPATWYRPCWSQMKAFALPAFAAGHIRINLKGREANGIVEPADYDAVCNEVEAMLATIVDGRSRKPLVREVVRTRSPETMLGTDPTLPDADLVVIWEEVTTDVVDTADLGRIGPLTYFRSGGHRPDGFFMASGPSIEPGTELATGTAVDIGPSILELMQCEAPEHVDGRSLLQRKASPC